MYDVIAAVDENEAMVAEFEGGLMEMNPRNKLESRHTELNEIDELLNDLKDSL